MVARDSNSVKGMIGELRALQNLEFTGAATSLMSTNDFGLDVAVQLPKKPLKISKIQALLEEKKTPSWKMSADVCHIQVKNVKNLTISRKHLLQWTAANISSPGSCFLISVEKGNYVLYDPPAISHLWETLNKCGYKNISANRARGFEIAEGDSKELCTLGKILAGWKRFSLLNKELDIDITATIKDRGLSANGVNTLIETLVLREYLEKEGFEKYMSHDIESLKDSISNIYESCIPLWNGEGDLIIYKEEDELKGYEEFLHENSYSSPRPDGSAYGRENRNLPLMDCRGLIPLITDFADLVQSDQYIKRLEKEKEEAATVRALLRGEV